MGVERGERDSGVQALEEGRVEDGSCCAVAETVVEDERRGETEFRPNVSKYDQPPEGYITVIAFKPDIMLPFKNRIQLPILCPPRNTASPRLPEHALRKIDYL